MIKGLLSALFIVLSVSEPICYRENGVLYGTGLDGYTCVHYTTNYNDALPIINGEFSKELDGRLPELELYVGPVVDEPAGTCCMPQNWRINIPCEERTSPTLSPTLSPVSQPEECGECDGKVTTLTFRNDGDDKHYTITDKKDENTLFEGDVLSGESFTVNGFDDKGTLGTEININGEGLHTSCSDPIFIGMEVGDLIITYGASRNGGKLCEDGEQPCDSSSSDSSESSDSKDGKKKKKKKKDSSSSEDKRRLLSDEIKEPLHIDSDSSDDSSSNKTGLSLILLLLPLLMVFM